MDHTPSKAQPQKFQAWTPEEPAPREKSNKALYATMFIAGIAASQTLKHSGIDVSEAVQQAVEFVSSGLDVDAAKAALIDFKDMQMEFMSSQLEGAKTLMDNVKDVFGRGSEAARLEAMYGAPAKNFEHLSSSFFGTNAQIVAGVLTLGGAVASGVAFVNIASGRSAMMKRMRAMDEVSDAVARDDVGFFGKIGRKITSVAMAAVHAVDAKMQALVGGAPKAAAQDTFAGLPFPEDASDPAWFEQAAPLDHADADLLWASAGEDIAGLSKDPWAVETPQADEDDDMMRPT
jgi:hypothetical protein